MGFDDSIRGKEGGMCNILGCGGTPATWWNHAAMRWYCSPCRQKIEANPVQIQKWQEDFYPSLQHPQFETREMMIERTDATKRGKIDEVVPKLDWAEVDGAVGYKVAKPDVLVVSAPDPYRRRNRERIVTNNLPSIHPLSDHINEDLPSFMVGYDRDWLINQLEAWPTRIDDERTINIGFLMGTAASVIRVLMNYREGTPLPEGAYRTPDEVKAESLDILNRVVKAKGYKGIVEAIDHLPSKEAAMEARSKTR